SQWPDARALSRQPRGGTETILLVEPNKALRQKARHTLWCYGYRVLEAASALRALYVWRQQIGRVDLLLTDVVLPDGLTGWELAEVLRAQHPDLKYLYSTSVDLDQLGNDFARRQRHRFVSKPWEPVLLAHIVRRCLDDKGATAE